MADKRTGSATQQLIEAAAAISGQPAAEITLEKAFDIIYQHDKEQIDQELDRAEYEALSPDQQQTIDETAEAMLQAAAIVLNKDRDKLTKGDINSAIEKAGKLDRIRIDTTPADPNSPDLVAQRAQRLKATTETVAAFLQRFIGDTIKVTITDQWESVIQGVKTFGELLKTVQPLLDELEDLQPYLEAELSKPEYNGLTARDFFENVTIDEAAEGAADTEQNTLLIKALAAAREARDRNEKAKSLPTVKYKKSHNVEVDVSKFSSVFFGFDPPNPQKDTDGQMSFVQLKYEKDGEKQITLCYNYGFDDEIFSRFGLKKKIDDEDYFILTTIFNMYENGNTTISATKLYKEMVGTDPNTKQLEKFIQRLYKLTATILTINDYDVKNAWGLIPKDEAQEAKERYREIITPLAPLTIGVEKYVANGRPVRAGIKIHDRPYMMALAKQIGQYTTVPKALLFNKIPKTVRYYRVLHYALKRIAQMKDAKTPVTHKILYTTFYKEIGETTANGQRYAKNILFKILEHFKTCEAHWIENYKEEVTPSTGEAGVKIFFPQKKLSKKK